MDFNQFAQLAAGRLTVKSALNPLLWLCAIVTVPCFGLAATMHGDRALMWLLIAVGCIPVLITCGVGLMFAIKSPDKLQSEDFQLRQQSLQILQGTHGGQIIDTQAVIAIANPAVETAEKEPA